MANPVRTSRGMRVQRAQTYPHRWGQGVTHLEAYLPVTENSDWIHEGRAKAWQTVCGRRSHAHDVDGDDPQPVTCKACLASGLVPKAWLPGEGS